jgi:hypothetical protein
MNIKILFIILVLVGAAYWFYTRQTQEEGTPAETQFNASTCSNGIQDKTETGVDCGGLCDPCPTCDDSIQNQNETGVDCGGPCEPCRGLGRQVTVNDTLGCRLVPSNTTSITIREHDIKPEKIKTAFLNATVDHMYLDPSKKNPSEIMFECHWGSKPKEHVDLYYCSGNYTTVRLDKNNIILASMLKKFKVGFNVTRTYDLDSRKKKYKVTNLEFQSINVTCTLI